MLYVPVYVIECRMKPPQPCFSQDLFWCRNGIAQVLALRYRIADHHWLCWMIAVSLRCCSWLSSLSRHSYLQDDNIGIWVVNDEHLKPLKDVQRFYSATLMVYIWITFIQMHHEQCSWIRNCSLSLKFVCHAWGVHDALQAMHFGDLKHHISSMCQNATIRTFGANLAVSIFMDNMHGSINSFATQFTPVPPKPWAYLCRLKIPTMARVCGYRTWPWPVSHVILAPSFWINNDVQCLSD